MNEIRFLAGNWYSRFKKQIKKIRPDIWIVIGELTLLLLMGTMHALEAGHYVNFVPTNGTFQNYNPVRRFLSGQVPYKDFQDYLGLGHLYIGTILTAALGGKYRSSLMAFQLIDFLSTALIFYFISRLVLKKNTAALILTNILLALLLIQPTFLEAVAVDISVKRALDYAMSTGLSARMLRGMILPLCCLVIMFLGAKIHNAVIRGRINISKSIILSVFSGVLAGICFPWSNDYGISCWLCLLIMTFFVTFSNSRKFFKSIFCFIIAGLFSLISLYLTIEAATMGHFSEWFFSTFGISGYQAWYYNTQEKSYYIFDVDFSYIMLIQAFLCIVYLVKVWKAKGEGNSIFRFGVPAYANMVCFCATNEYKLLSGGPSREVALIVLFATIVSELVNYIGNVLLKEKSKFMIIAASTVVCLAWVISACQSEFDFYFLTTKEGVYVEQMDGNMTSLGEDLLSTARFLGDKKVFATYASAQELLSDHFHPSGTDYVIHVLGDHQREDYLHSFENENFDYTATIDENYFSWEFWIQRANWFFYRNLYADWHPVYANSYEIYWERNEKNMVDTIYKDDIKVNVIQIDASTQRITVETDERISGTADVFIDYAAKKKNNISSKFLFTSMVRQQNTGKLLCDSSNAEYLESAYLRSANSEYIPVTIVDGFGEVTLTSKPEKSTKLEIYSAECSQIYRVQYQYIKVDKITESKGLTILHISKNNRTNEILDKIKTIEIEGRRFNIEKDIRDIKKYVHDSNKSNYAYIVIKTGDAHISKALLKTNNMFRVE